MSGLKDVTFLTIVFQYHAGDNEVCLWTPWNPERIISWLISELHSLHSLSSSGFYNIWTHEAVFSPQLKKKSWFPLLRKFPEGETQCYLNLGNITWRGTFTLSQEPLVFYYLIFYHYKSKVLTIPFDAKSYITEHWKNFLNWCWLIS